KTRNFALTQVETEYTIRSCPRVCAHCDWRAWCAVSRTRNIHLWSRAMLARVRVALPSVVVLAIGISGSWIAAGDGPCRKSGARLVQAARRGTRTGSIPG